MTLIVLAFVAAGALIGFRQAGSLEDALAGGTLGLGLGAAVAVNLAGAP